MQHSLSLNFHKLQQLVQNTTDADVKKQLYIRVRMQEIKQQLDDINENVCDLMDEMTNSDSDFNHSFDQLVKQNKQNAEFNDIFLPYMIMHQVLST